MIKLVDHGSNGRLDSFYIAYCLFFAVWFDLVWTFPNKYFEFLLVWFNWHHHQHTV